MLQQADSFDEKLVRQAQAGDGRAFNALVSKYRARIMQLTLRYARNQADAEDLVQDTFFKAYRGLPSFRGDSSFYSWLHRIAINAAMTAFHVHARDAHVVSMEGSGSEQIEEAATPENLAVTDEILAAIGAAVDALGEDQRRAIVLREIDGLSYQQVAGAMSCPVGTVRSRVFRAREAIDLRVRDSFEGGLGRVGGEIC
jgi:RNA polymerase sigma-70 factor (ECF subfamily)